MTNNEAAKWIQLYIDLANIDPTTGEEAYLNEDARKTLEAMGMAVDALIDKQAAADQIIDGLPSAQPEQRWIPCSERLPEEHEWVGTKRFGTTISDEVYVTFENPEGERFTKHLSFQNGKLSSFDQRKIDAFYNGSVPIAWMPLPEPYREERTEEWAIQSADRRRLMRYKAESEEV